MVDIDASDTGVLEVRKKCDVEIRMLLSMEGDEDKLMEDVETIESDREIPFDDIIIGVSEEDDNRPMWSVKVRPLRGTIQYKDLQNLINDIKSMYDVVGVRIESSVEER